MHKYETLFQLFDHNNVITTQQCILHYKLTRKECEDPTHSVQTSLAAIFCKMQ